MDTITTDGGITFEVFTRKGYRKNSKNISKYKKEILELLERANEEPMTFSALTTEIQAILQQTYQAGYQAGYKKGMRSTYHRGI